MVNKEASTINQLHDLLNHHNLSISTAESCTGGLISSELTRLPNSSRYFIGSIVAYQNAIKTSLLGVSEKTLEEHGAVSEQTVIEMVKGVAQLMKTDIAVSISGIAGPGGGSPEKPVGTIWTAYYIMGKVHTKLLQLQNNRDENRKVACELVLKELIRYTESAEKQGDNE